MVILLNLSALIAKDLRGLVSAIRIMWRYNVVSCCPLLCLTTKLYCLLQFVAKKLDKRLSDLGARAIIERGLGDDQHPSG